MADEDYHVESLKVHHDRTDFSCGVEALDRYFRQQARQDQRRRAAAPYVLVETDTGAIAGYYTLSNLSITPANLPDTTRRRLPRYGELPAILIGRLAVDQRYRGRGLGELLLFDAQKRCLRASAEVGAIVVVVDAKDEAVLRFYERYGFQRMLDHDFRLFVLMETVARMWGEAV